MIQNVDLGIRDRAANGNKAAAVVPAASPIGNVHGSFRRPVEIVQFGRIAVGEEKPLQVRGQFLTAAENLANTGFCSGNFTASRNKQQHGGHKMKRSDSFLRDQLGKVGGIAMSARTANTKLAPVTKGQKNSQTETSKL